MKVLFICYTNFLSVNSGSLVRPYMIYKAFVSKGYEVLLINGDVKERMSKFLRYKKDDAFKNVDYCYIEPSTYPSHPLDYIIFEYIRKLNIPVGLFYRDMYYKFPEFFKKSGYKKYELSFRYKIDWLMFKRLSKVIFFPSQTMASYFQFSNKATLPPAGEIKFTEKKELNDSIIYVGGVNEIYGTPILLEALKIVNINHKRITLNIVCREYNRCIFEKYKKEDWLNISHVSGEELKSMYYISDIAIIPIKINTYNNLAIPVKLFEYMSFGLPIISTDCFETACFIRKNEIGVVVQDNPESLAEAIINLYENPDMIKKLSENVKKTLINGNLWTDRIDAIEKYLIN